MIFTFMCVFDKKESDIGVLWNDFKMKRVWIFIIY